MRDHKHLMLMLGFVVLAAVGCGGTTTEIDIPCGGIFLCPSNDPAVPYTVSPGANTLMLVGDTVRLIAYSCAANSLFCGPFIGPNNVTSTWSVTPDTVMASVGPMPGQAPHVLLKALRPGTARIEVHGAADPSLTATLDYFVADSSAVGNILLGSFTSVRVTQTITVAATVVDSFSHTFYHVRPTSWSLSDSTKLAILSSVMRDGSEVLTVRGMSPGTAEVRAHFRGITASHSVTVNP